MKIHLIGNAHLDPVWLWDWREGLSTGLITCRTILDLMDEDPELTFNRGEAAIYAHIERTDPETFRRIKRYVKSGRWDLIGGTYIQPDDNMPATENFVRQYTRGLRYFASRFGKPVRVAWSADCFGHAEGMPEILAAAGMKYFAFTRPDPGTLPLAKPAFWWVGPGGSRILAYRPTVGWYGTDRDEVIGRLDKTVESAATCDLQNVAVLYGLGDHGGGPSRRQLADIKAWAKAHPEVRVIHSTMHRFFGELEKEVLSQEKSFIQEHRGELNFVLRGCYSSVAKFKFLYRQTEVALCAAERTDAILAAKLSRTPAKLDRAWDSMLFGAFHDILPGTSIERSYDDQIGQLNFAMHEADAAQFDALNALAMQVNTRVLPVARGSDMPTGVAAMVWNPHATPFDGFVEIEACVDDRQIPKYRDETVNNVPVRVLDHRKKPLPFQLVNVENRFAPHIAWRKRAVVPVKLPPMGWSMLEMAWVEGAPASASPASEMAASATEGTADTQGSVAIANGTFRIETGIGQTGIKVLRNGKPFLLGDGLAAGVFEDPFGSWGGGADNNATGPELAKLQERWRVTDAKVLEAGRWRATLWVRLAGKDSRIDLTIQLYAGRNAVDVSARVLWNQRAARLKLILPLHAKRAEYDVAGGRVVRQVTGDVPGGKWMRTAETESSDFNFGFASDALYAFNVGAEQTHVTVVRSTRFADSTTKDASAEPWLPATDQGELKFRFLLAPGDERLPVLADLLEQPPVVSIVPSKKGPLPATGSLLSLEPGNLRLLAFKPAEDGKGWIVRMAETAGRSTNPRLKLLGQWVELDPVPGKRIATYRIEPAGSGFKARLSNAAEDRVVAMKTATKSRMNKSKRSHA